MTLPNDPVVPIIQPDSVHSKLLPASDRMSRLPWWALVAALLGVLFAWQIATSEDYARLFGAIFQGIGVTIFVTIVAYALSVCLGLIVALGRISKNPILYQVSTFYVEIIRGVPTLVLLLYISFVAFPALIGVLNGWGADLIAKNINGGIVDWMKQLTLRNVDNMLRVVVALTIAYSAFLAEIFRAGIKSIDKGQMEAARALGMTHWEAMRHIILRQAFRRVLPPLVNDFVAMLKDSSLVSALGVQDITGRGKVYAASSFDVFKAYNIVAYMYLVMTLLLSMLAKWLEQRLRRELKS